MKNIVLLRVGLVGIQQANLNCVTMTVPYMTRSKTRRIKKVLQGLIMEINSTQGELEVTPHWVSFLQVEEDLRTT